MTETPTTSRPKIRKPRRQIDAKLRARIEAAVERMIAALDALDGPAEDKEAGGDDEDGDADDPTRFEGQQSERMHMSLTPDDAEPALGWTTTTNQTAHQFHGGTDDREGPDADQEPSLGSVAVHELNSQGNWSQGNADDREDDPGEMGIGDAEGLAEQLDGEPSLGSFDRMTNQEHAYQDRRGWAPQDGEQDPGHRKPSEKQRKRWRERKGKPPQGFIEGPDGMMYRLHTVR